MQPAAVMAMREWHGQWVIDVGTDHGFPRDGATHVAVQGSDPVLQARVRQVMAGYTIVEPLGWRPKPGLSYPMVLSGLAMSPITVKVGGGPGDDEAVARRLREAIGTSPEVTVAATGRADITVSTPAHGCFTLHDTTGRRLATCPMEPEQAGRREVAQRLEHIARWQRIRHLSNPVSRLAGRARVAVIAAEPDDYDTPLERAGLAAGAGEAIELEYWPHEYGFSPPKVFLRVDNTWDRPLFVALLSLTDRFRIHADFFPGGFLDGGSSVAAGDGQAVESMLPPDRLVRPGARVRDWLMLIVSEARFDSDFLTLPQLGDAGGKGLPGTEPADIVEHLALKARHRGAVGAPATAGDWWVSHVALDTRVPGDGGEFGE